MSTLKQRFLLVSDMHYTTEETYHELQKIYPNAKTSAAAGNAFGKTQRQKIEKIYEDIMEENRRSKLDAVLVLGDLSIDDYDYRQLPISYCKKFKEDCMDRLPCPAYALPGNHDSWPNDLWKEMMGYDRRYSVEFGDCAFIMDDSFADVPAGPKDPASGGRFTPMDADFLRECLTKHKGKKIFLCSHHIDGRSFSEECQKLLRESGDVVFMYRGHCHVNIVADMGEDCGNIKLCDIGGYGYAGQVVDGKYTFNIFDFSWAWGYQIIEIYDDKIKTYHVKTNNRYIADNGVFDIEETVEGEVEYTL